MESMLVFALGNPGREYANTYHNAGVLAQIALRKNLEERFGEVPHKKHGEFWYRKYPELILAGYVPDEDFEMPERYMNQAGGAVAAALSFFKLPPANLILFHDDSDLFVGDYKLEPGRGAAGHHGVLSTIEALGTKEFTRGRIGIRPKAEHLAQQKAGEFVLDQIRKEDRDILEKAFQELAKKVMEKV